MAKPNRTCFCCGKPYHYCPHCPEFDGSPSYLNTWCSERCSVTFETLSNYLAGRIDEKEAYKQIERFDFSDVDSWDNKDNAFEVKDLLDINTPKVKTVSSEISVSNADDASASSVTESFKKIFGKKKKN